MQANSRVLLALAGLLLVAEARAAIKFGSRDSSIGFEQAGSYFIINEEIEDYSGTLKLLDESSGRISGENIFFQNGILRIGGTKELLLTGTYDSATQNEINLEDGNSIELPSGDLEKDVMVSAGAEVTIFGAPVFQNPITLTDNTSVLNIGLQSKLTQDILLNGGTIVLQDDLSMRSGKRILGGGTIDVNGRTLYLPGGDVIDADVTFLNGNDIPLTANINLGGVFTFSGAGGTTEVTGNGYGITFTGSGGLAVDPTHTAFLSNIFLRNFGALPTRGFFDIDPTSTMVLQDCTIELAGNYAHDSGTIIVRGQSSRLITNGFTFDTSGALVFIRVDGTIWEYDNKALTDANPFTFTDEAEQKKPLNAGIIRSATARASLDLTATSISMVRDYMLATDSNVNVLNASPGSPKAVTMDLNGHVVFFPGAGSSLFNLDPNVNLTLNNAILSGYNKDLVSYGDVNATLEFGSGTQIRLFEDVTISGADKDWDFVGSGSICGSGATLTLDGSDRLTVTSSSTLTLRGLRIVCKNVDSLSCLDSGSKIVFSNCTLVVEQAGLEFSTGNVDVLGSLEVCGGDPTAVDTPATLAFTSAGQFRVLSESKMRVSKGVELEYRADPSGDGSDTAATKRHLLLLDPTSVLQLDGAILHSTTTALALDYGRLIVDDKVSFVIDGTGAESAEIGTALDVLIRPGGTLEVDGVITYISSSFP